MIQEKIKIVKENYAVILFFIYSAAMIIDAKFTSIAPTILLGGYCLYSIVKKRQLKYSYYEIGLLIFTVGTLISFIQTPYSMEPGRRMLLRITRFLWIPFFLGQFNIGYREKAAAIKGGLLGILYWFVLFVFDFLNNVSHLKKINNISTIEVLKRNELWQIRYRIIADSISYAGVVLASLVIVGICILIKEKKLRKKEKTVIYIGVFLSGIMMLATQSRSATVSLLTALVTIAIINNRKKYLKYLIIGMIIIGGIFFRFRENPYVQRYKFKDDAVLARIEVYKEAFRIFKENPIKGVGFENFKQAQNPKAFRYHGKYQHPHNMPLKTLSETGIIGFLAYYSWMGILLVKTFLRRRETTYLIGFGVILNMIIFENFEMVLSTTKGLPIIIFILGMCINRSYKKYSMR